MRERLGRVRSIETLAPGVLAVDVEAIEPRDIQFRPGQFVSVRVDERARRSFSVASPPGRPDGFELVVKPAAAGRTAAFVAGLEVGAELRYFGPMGYFLLERSHPGDVVFAATGVGISAILPMVEELLPGQPGRQAMLFWGLRRREDGFWAERLAGLAARFSNFVWDLRFSEEGGGRISPPVIATVDGLREPTYYLCGNGNMIEQVSEGLHVRGVDRRRIRTEIFYPAALP